jgi:hypothetical protein
MFWIYDIVALAPMEVFVGARVAATTESGNSFKKIEGKG